MDRRSLQRIAAATAIAPLTAPILFAVALAMAERHMRGVYLGIALFLPTSAFAYAATIVLGVPAFLMLQRTQMTKPSRFWSVGAAAGLLVFLVLHLLIHLEGSPLGFAGAAGICAAAGAVAATVFALIARKRPG